MNGLNINPFYYKRWLFGIPVPIWLNRIEMIEKFVTELKLKPAALETLTVSPVMEQVAGPEVATKALKIRGPGFPGGIKSPHLHLRGEVFLLKEEAWQKFSTALLDDLQSRLTIAKGRGVSFEQAMEISEAVDALGIHVTAKTSK